jgi:hypothetical protein
MERPQTGVLTPPRRPANEAATSPTRYPDAGSPQGASPSSETAPPRRTSLTAIAAPGPILRGPIGDLFNVTLIYDAKMPHSIDLHASRTATDKSMRELAPGESLVYQYQAQYSGIFMYHCGAAPALEHIANGMFGAVVIDSWRGGDRDLRPRQSHGVPDRRRGTRVVAAASEAQTDGQPH